MHWPFWGGTTAVLTAAPVYAKAAAFQIDFASQQGRLKAFMMMRGALDDRLLIGCISDIYYGNVNAELTPLFGPVGAIFSRYRPHTSSGRSTGPDSGPNHSRASFVPSDLLVHGSVSSLKT